ncbi:hypothetical protein TNCV_2649791 [Trichonephila clavipes]|nr:hypothetical protein TNCV_2649791 [Trichonephila clavipes]
MDDLNEEFEIRIQILVPHPETHPVLTFDAPASAISVPEGRNYSRPALSGKVIGTQIRFKILIPHPEMHTGLIFDATVRSSSVARLNENPNAGLESNVSNSDNIRLSYRSFCSLISDFRFFHLRTTGYYFRLP